MILSNFTFNVNYSHYLLFCHVLENSCKSFLDKSDTVSHFNYFKLRNEIENGGDTVAIQLYFESEAKLALFSNESLDEFLHLFEAFRGNFVFYNSILEEI